MGGVGWGMVCQMVWESVVSTYARTHARGLGADEEGQEAVVLDVAGAGIAPHGEIREGKDEGVVVIFGHGLEEVCLCVCWVGD
jgi:hypothetical protein